MLMLLLMVSCLVAAEETASSTTPPTPTEAPPPPKCGFFSSCEFCGRTKTVCCNFMDSLNVCCNSQPHENCSFATENVYSVSQMQQLPQRLVRCGWLSSCTTCGHGKTVCCGKLEYPATCCEKYIHRNCDDPNARHVYEFTSRISQRLFAKLRPSLSGGARGLVTLTIVRSGVSDLANVRLHGVEDDQLFSVEVGPNGKCGAETTSLVPIFDSPVHSGQNKDVRVMTSLENDLPVTLRLLTPRGTNDTFACGTLALL